MKAVYAFLVATFLTLSLTSFAPSYTHTDSNAFLGDKYSTSSHIQDPIGVEKVRKALNSVGGGNVSIAFGLVGNCGTALIDACVQDRSTIYIKKSLPNREYQSLRSLMAHEYAHVITTIWTSWHDIRASPAYELFKKDYEFIADCMAIERVGFSSAGYDYTCSDEQLESASRLWTSNWN